ncbi:phage tail tape measure protein [Paracoccus litorisediminis]|uniref:phage tail tape measure protein n=1 Tax=Paracoccus litorisediminis TaxID=2006130 RepID=UPI00372E4B75
MAGNQRLNATITIGGVVAATLSRAVSEANTKLGTIGSALGSAQNQIGTAIRQNDAAIEKARGGVLDAVGAFYALKGAIAAPVKAAMDFESAMADVTKVVDFDSPESLQLFKKDLRDLSKEVPMTVTGLAEIAAAAGQAGIAGDDLITFTESAAKIGTAFDIAAGDAGDAMAKLKTGLGLTIGETVKLFDAMNHLSNAQASSAADVLDVVRRVGAMGKQFGFTAEQTAAFGSAMLSSGAQSEVAATSFLNMGRALTKGSSATKRQAAAMRALGLDSEKVARRMQEDAVATTIDVMERLAKLPKHVQASVSSDIFGDEARALGPLLTNLDLIRDSVGMVSNEASYAGSAFKEFQTRNGVFASQLITFGNRITDLAIAIGDALIPPLRQLMEIFGPVIDQVTALAAAHPKLIGNLALAAGGFIAFRGALAALRFAGLFALGGALRTLSIGLNAISVSLGLVSTGFRLVSLAIAANPIGATITAIAGAAYLIYRNWDEVGPWFQKLWGNVGKTFIGFAQFVSGVFTGDLGQAWQGIKTVWSGMTGYWATLWEGVANIFTVAWTNWIAPVLDKLGMLEPIKEAWDGLKAYFGPVLQWIGDKFTWLGGVLKPVLDGLTWVKENGAAIGDKVSGWFTGRQPGETAEGEWNRRVNGAPQMRAVGGAFRPGPLIVGERGPEAMYEQRAGFIAHNRQLLAMARNAGKIAALGSALGAMPSAAASIEDIMPAAPRRAAGHQVAATAAPQVNVGGITVYAQPGQDPRQIADAVLRELESRARGALFDGGY